LKTILLAILKSGAGQVAALLLAAISVKILAVVAGPAGVGLYSLLRQIQQTLSALASIGGQNAIVQGVASRVGQARQQFIASVMWGIALASLLVAVAMLAFADSLAAWLLVDHVDGAVLIRWTSLAVVLGTLLIVVRSLLNGYMAIGGVAYVNVAVAFGALVLAYPAARAYDAGHGSALVALLCGSLGLGLVFAVYVAWGRGCFAGLTSAMQHPKGKVFGEFFGIGLPSLVGLFVGLGAVLVVRGLVARWHGLPAAGHFDAAWSISLTFVVAFLASLQTYLLPALSEGQSASGAWQKVLASAARLSILIAVPLLAGLIVLKPLLVRVLYSSEFMPALELLRWTLLGDYLRVIGWVLATNLIARADMRAYLGVELAWNVVFVTVATAFLSGGIEGVGPAYVAAYFVYLLLLIGRSLQRHAWEVPRGAIVLWFAGAAATVVVSFSTWHDTEVEPWKLVLVLGACATVWLCLSAQEKQGLNRACAKGTRRVAGMFRRG